MTRQEFISLNLVTFVKGSFTEENRTKSPISLSESKKSAHGIEFVEVTKQDLVVFQLPKLFSFRVRTTRFILLRDPPLASFYLK